MLFDNLLKRVKYIAFIIYASYYKTIHVEIIKRGNIMSSQNVNVRVKGELREHLDQQIGAYGLYENASEYIRDLIRHDIKNKKEAWKWLKDKLEPAMIAKESSYTIVSAKDVIARNMRKLKTDS